MLLNCLSDGSVIFFPLQWNLQFIFQCKWYFGLRLICKNYTKADIRRIFDDAKCPHFTLTFKMQYSSQFGGGQIHDIQAIKASDAQQAAALAAEDHTFTNSEKPTLSRLHPGILWILMCRKGSPGSKMSVGFRFWSPLTWCSLNTGDWALWKAMCCATVWPQEGANEGPTMSVESL